MAAKAKVQCAGGGKPPTLTVWSRRVNGYVFLRDGDPCGWTGRRKNDRDYYGPHGMEPAATIDPCPRCGGKVELIGHTQEVER